MSKLRYFLDCRKVDGGPWKGLVIPLVKGRHFCEWDVDHANIPDAVNTKIWKRARANYAKEWKRGERFTPYDPVLPVGVSEHRLLPGYLMIALCPKCARRLLAQQWPKDQP